MTLCRFGFVAIMHQDQAYEMAIAVPFGFKICRVLSPDNMRSVVDHDGVVRGQHPTVEMAVPVEGRQMNKYKEVQVSPSWG
jgi:hypothetical protein